MNEFIFSFDFGDDGIQPLAYGSEGKPLNCGDLASVSKEEHNGNFKCIHFYCILKLCVFIMF